MDVEACSDCIEVHAERVVEMYGDLDSLLNKIRESEDRSKAKKTLIKWLKNAVELGFFKGHGKINIEIDGDILHILDREGQRLC